MKASRSPFRYRLFDSDGLPWASRLDWPWLFLLSMLTAFSGAIFLGIYVGIWVKGKGRSALPLCVYLALAIMYIAGIAAAWMHAVLADRIGMCEAVLWLVGAFTLRHEVVRYYTEREGVTFRLGPWLTLFFSVWYICGSLRADYPLDETGKAAEGVLKLTV